MEGELTSILPNNIFHYKVDEMYKNLINYSFLDQVRIANDFCFYLNKIIKRERKYSPYNQNLYYPILKANTVTFAYEYPTTNNLLNKINYNTNNKYGFKTIKDLIDKVPDLKCLVIISRYINKSFIMIYGKYYYSKANPEINCYQSFKPKDGIVHPTSCTIALRYINDIEPCKLMDLYNINLSLAKFKNKKKLYLRDFNYFIDILNEHILLPDFQYKIIGL